jgi:hypothetical protein
MVMMLKEIVFLDEVIHFSVAQQPNSGLGRIIVEVSTSYTDTNIR